MPTPLDAVSTSLILIAIAVAFAVSASAGFGGSLILVPALALMLGGKSGVALASLLLAGNNVVKVFAYRRTMPYRAAVVVVGLVVLGALVGARIFVWAPEDAVAVAVIASFGLTFLVERFDLSRLRRLGGPLLALGAGLTSGFSGTSGPLKGLAVRSLNLNRAHVVGALSLVSLAGDATKAAVFTEAGMISSRGYYLAAASIPLMVVATFAGRRINREIGERGFTGLFWLVMAGYTARLVVGL
jgi:hypothetical protein